MLELRCETVTVGSMAVNQAVGGKGRTGLSIFEPNGLVAGTYKFTGCGDAACFRPWWPHMSIPGASEEVVWM